MRRGLRAETAPVPAGLWPGLREETSERRRVRAWCLRLRTPRPCRRHQVFEGFGTARRSGRSPWTSREDPPTFVPQYTPDGSWRPLLGRVLRKGNGQERTAVLRTD